MTTLNIFPVGSDNSSYVGQIEIKNESENTKPGSSNGVETIIILDVSGSMGQNVQKIVTKYLPNAFEKIGYGSEDIINLVTFATRSKTTKYTINTLRTSKQCTEGVTNMAPGIVELAKVISASKHNQIRILTLSDGEIHDQQDTMNSVSTLARKMNGNYVVSSTSIRFITGHGSNPDTRGLSSILQLGTQSKDNFIIDIDCYDKEDSIVSKIAELLQDTLGSSCKITSNENTLLTNPWTNASNNIYLTTGINTFWLNKMPTSDLVKLVVESNGIIKEQEVKVEVGNKLNFESYNTILKDKVDYFMKRLKILKVVNTENSQKEIDSIVQYFQQLEKCFAMSEPSAIDIINNKGLQSRLAFFKEIAKKKSLSVSMMMSEISNNDKVSQLNSAQQAGYLRSASNTTNARSLAKRALKQGLDFDEVARKEVKEMNKHIDELNDIDDTNHYTSFYSLETTLQGIKAVCELDDKAGTINQMSVVDILQLLNIVGLPCRGPIGDFPDPKTYHLEELMLGTCVSMADIMIAKESGSKLTDPYGDKKEIVNVIPFYDDDRIQQFLMKYAPTLLEYVASVGMRNMILDVPHTYKYTVVGGLWNMVRRLDGEKTEINVDILTKLVITYKTAVNGLFDYVNPLIIEQSEEDRNNKLSYYISNNGTTNMISPIITIMEKAYNGDETQSKFIPDILRALFSFEIYQVTRKFFRSDDDKIVKRKQMLDSLLGINFEKHATSLPKLFESQKNPKHHNKPDINKIELKSILDRIYWLDHITLLPNYILNSFGKDGKKKILDTSILTKEVVEQSLGISDLDQFKFNCVVQSFLFNNKADRVEDNKGGIGKMKIHDCIHSDVMDKMVGDYIEKQYRAYYQSELSKQEKVERETLAKELVDQMIGCESEDEFIRLFREGIKRNHVSAVIYDTYQLGYSLLRDKIFNPDVKCPLRYDKLWIFTMGSTKEDEIVWNKGNPIRVSLLWLENSFKRVGLEVLWQTIYPLYKAKNIYIYRSSDMPNRHTHCNSKISFWAMGYPTVGKYFADISEEERQEYMSIHTNCCGIWNGKLVKPA